MFLEVIAFLKDLKANNNREWFEANRSRYEKELKEPAMAFIEAARPHVESISPHLVAGKNSLFRIHRDVRFSKDKSPYKTHMGIHFRHEDAPNAHCPGIYVHVDPEHVFVGVGIWHPDNALLAQIREAIVNGPSQWKEATRGIRLEGDSLKKPPKGVDPAHPLIEDLKRKDFITSKNLPLDSPKNKDFVELSVGWAQTTTPLLRFLCSALRVPF